MTNKEVQQLLFRYRNDLCTPLERESIEQWFEQSIRKSNVQINDENLTLIGENLRDRVLVHIIKPKRKIRKLVYYTTASIAAVGLLVFFLTNLFRAPSAPELIVNKEQHRAFLTLTSGETIDLKEIAIGETIQNGNMRISKSSEGEIEYTLIGRNFDLGENVLVVPKGGKYKIMLPDSSQVWLNSASELKYPSNFEGNTREVSLIGEAYFEISKNRKKPFIVHTKKANVQVLGTKFNIQSYPNSDKEVTAVTHGSVRVYNSLNNVILKANEQVEIDKKGKMITNKSLDEITVLAWKDGKFKFSGTKLKDIAKQVERWYDVNIKVDPEIENLDFYGVIAHTESANQLFEILEATKTIKVKIEKNTIYIEPYNKN